jgi:hypothetical protein
MKNELFALRSQIQSHNFSFRPHALQHAVKEGFTVDDMVQVVLHGKVIEIYPSRKRALFYANVTIEGIMIPLHVVCEHRNEDAPVDFITAYLPDQDIWETPTQRR